MNTAATVKALLITILFTFTSCASPSTKVTTESDSTEAKSSAQPREISRPEALAMSIVILPLIPICVVAKLAGFGGVHDDPEHTSPESHPSQASGARSSSS